MCETGACVLLMAKPKAVGPADVAGLYRGEIKTLVF